MADIVRVVQESSTSGKNKAQLTVTPSGTRLAHWIDWSDFLCHFFKTIPNITTSHHFKVSKSEPGMVIIKEYANSPQKRINIFVEDIDESSLRGKKPEEIIPSGLDAKRQWYGTYMMKSDQFAPTT